MSNVHPLEYLTEGDIAARERMLDSLREWSRANVGAFEGSSVILHGSLARGDYWENSDVDLLLDGRDHGATVRLEKDLREWWAGRHPQVTLDLWTLDQPLANYNGRSADDRKLPSPIQFGLYGFDVFRNHVVLLGNDFLAAFQPSGGKDLLALADDRLTKLVTRDQPGSSDPRPKMAMEALKAAAIIVAVKDGRSPSRDKRTVLSIFIGAAAGKNIPTETGITTWAAYRYGTPVPPDAELDRFVGAVVTAFRQDVSDRPA